MIRSVAVALAKHWSVSGVINELDEETYQYGLELLISTLINLFIMIGISTAFGHPLILIPYLLAFIPFRLFAGGYHAKSHLTCILFNAITYFASCLISLNIEKTFAIFASVIVCSISLALIYLFAPLPANSKPLTQDKKTQNRNISLSIAQGFMVLCILLNYVHLLGTRSCNMLFCGQMVSVVLLATEKTACIISN